MSCPHLPSNCESLNFKPAALLVLLAWPLPATLDASLRTRCATPPWPHNRWAVTVSGGLPSSRGPPHRESRQSGKQKLPGMLPLLPPLAAALPRYHDLRSSKEYKRRSILCVHMSGTFFTSKFARHYCFLMRALNQGLAHCLAMYCPFKLRVAETIADDCPMAACRRQGEHM